MLDPESIKSHYRTLNQNELLQLAHNPKGLRPDVVPVFIEVLKERNIGMEYIDSILLETNYFLGEERISLMESVRTTTCSNCLHHESLKGYSIRTITSTIIYCNQKVERLIICSSCAMKKELNSFFYTLIFGWWSRRGLFWTPITLCSKIGNIFIRKSICRDVLNDFIDTNTLSLRKYGTEKITLEKIITSYNSAGVENVEV
jgi:hypothetical protein